MLYTEVISGLWIGDIDIMYNKKFIQDNNIEVVINCTNYQFSESVENTQNIRIPLTDDIYHSIDIVRQHKQKILQFIDSQLEEKHILICCREGTSISPFLVALYLVNYADIPKSEVRKIIQSKNEAISMDFDLNLLDL